MRTVLWDLDGTIADTEVLHFHAWQETVIKYDVSYPYKRFKAECGMRNGDILPNLLHVAADSPLISEVATAKEAAFRRLVRAEGLQALPGVMTWLQRFRAEGVKQALSSSAPMANIAVMVDTLDIGDFFLALVSGAELAKSKPHPAIFLNSAAALNVKPAACLVIEDSIHGIQAAQSAGMGSVAVGTVTQLPELTEMLHGGPESSDGPAVASVASLEALTWPMCQSIWESAQA